MLRIQADLVRVADEIDPRYRQVALRLRRAVEQWNSQRPVGGALRSSFADLP